MTNLRLIIILLFASLVSSCDSITDSNNVTSESNHITPPAELTPPDLKAPLNNTDSLSGQVKMEWEKIDGIDTYQIQLAKTNNFKNPVTDRRTPANSYEITGLESNSSYFWRVRSVADSIDTPEKSSETSPWSGIWSFKTSDYQEAPKVPDLLSPDNQGRDQPVTLQLSWKEVAEADKYHVQIASDNQFNSILVENEDNLTSYEVSGLDYESVYFWRVRIIDNEGPGDWSDFREFTTSQKSESLKAPNLSSPSNGVTNQLRNITLEWEELSNATDYRVQVSTSENFDDAVLDETVSTSSYEASNLTYDTEYFWQVQALNESETSDWSSAYTFITQKQPDQSAQSSDIWVSAYFASWNHYAPPGGNWGHVPTEEIDWDAFTHMIYFAMSAQPDGTLSAIADYENMAPDRIHAITEAGEQNNTPVIISIGGWGNYDGFSNAIKPANRAVFVASLVEMITVWGFHGIDLDMEPIRDSDVDNYKATVKDLYQALQALDTPLSEKPLLTAALMGTHASLFAEVHDYFDQINLMTYDYSGAWEGWVSWHNSPLFSGGNTFPGLSRELPSTEGTLNSFLSAGVPAEKLGIGIDFYGYVWNGQVDKPLQSWDSPAPSVQDNVAYHEIMDSYHTSERANYDSEAVAAYLSIPSSDPSQRKFISYDDEQVVREKIRYARQQGLGGAIIWELGGGHRKDQPAGQKDNLLQAIKNELQ